TSTLERLNGSVAPERLTTTNVAFSAVVKRRPHWPHWRRRRMAAPSSAVRLSTTRVSVARQKGQCMAGALLSADRAATPESGHPSVIWGQSWGIPGENRENL